MALTIPIRDDDLEKRLYELYQQLKSQDRSKTWTDMIKIVVEEYNGGMR